MRRRCSGHGDVFCQKRWEPVLIFLRTPFSRHFECQLRNHQSKVAICHVGPEALNGPTVKAGSQMRRSAR